MINQYSHIILFINSSLISKAFNIDYIDSIHVVMALAQFERTLISTNSKYDTI